MITFLMHEEQKGDYKGISNWKLPIERPSCGSYSLFYFGIL